MKKQLFVYLFAALAVCLGFTSCSDDEDPVHPMSGVYSMTAFETADSPHPNFPVNSPLYADIYGGEEVDGVFKPDLFMQNVSGILRLMGGALLPQVLNTIELRADGNVCASYIDKPTVKTDSLSVWAMGAGGLTGQVLYPKKDDVLALAVKSGFVDSTTGLAFWTEQGGLFTLKLNIENIIKEATGQSNVSDLSNLIQEILKKKPAEIKALLAQFLDPGMKNISDATIQMLQNWALNGIPMTVSEENGSTKIYLTKKDLTSLFALRGNDNDLIILWKALDAKGIIPEEAKSAFFLIYSFVTNWDKVQRFNVGLSLEKK